jgi:hypothetical protein
MTDIKVSVCITAPTENNGDPATIYTPAFPWGVDKPSSSISFTVDPKSTPGWGFTQIGKYDGNSSSHTQTQLQISSVNGVTKADNESLCRKGASPDVANFTDSTGKAVVATTFKLVDSDAYSGINSFYIGYGTVAGTCSYIEDPQVRNTV